MNELIGSSTFLGPAKVLAVDGQRALVALPDAKAWATLAMVVQYQPAVDDVLLVIGREDAFWALGVVAGRGHTTMLARGDILLAAPQGRIDLQARDGVEIRTGTLRCVAAVFDTVVGSLRQRCDDFLSLVKGTARWRARRSETKVDQVHRTEAGRIVQNAEGDVVIDGRKINLG